jgi:hypothetical protein
MQQIQRNTTKSHPWVSTAVTWAVWVLAAYVLVAAAAGILAG